jgi:UDP-MurNAc hydroxylase
MKLTLISQACLLVESGDDQLLVDPWLLGSCYWRSWWHFPPGRPERIEPERVSAIYFTHEHPDHLHLPSLRSFRRDVRILVPRFPVDRMASFLAGRGFTRVEEIPHGGRARVGSIDLHSYQAGQDDSLAVISDGETTILDMNDAKASAPALRRLVRRHGPIDFFLRSHAPAVAFPFCYTADDERDLELLPREYFIHLFESAVRVLQPRFAVPFASNVCYLHPESRDQNEHLILPDEVVAACGGRVGETELLAMSPGDSWERGRGFTLAPRPTLEEQLASIARLQEEKAGTIAQAVADERARGAVDFATFQAYVERALRAVPWPLRMAFPGRIAFEAADARFFVVDVRWARVHHAASADGCHSIVRANPHLLRDAIEKNGLNLIAISRRIRVHLRRGGTTCDAAFWGLLTLYELGYFPLGNLLRRRVVAGLLARWREIAATVPALLLPSRSLEMIIKSKTPRA